MKITEMGGDLLRECGVLPPSICTTNSPNLIHLKMKS